MNLDSITFHIKDHIKLFEQEYSNCMTSEGFFIDDISQYVFSKKGKNIRPIVTMLSAKLLGDIDSHTIRYALVLELLHTASLIHDDVIDRAETRRNNNTVNKIWGNNAAILFGDYIYGRCLSMIEREEDFAMLPLFAKLGRNLPMGELLQKDVSHKTDYCKESYFSIIGKKTAALFEASCSIGAMSVSKDKEKIEALGNMGYNIGIAFQIIDDIIDYMPQNSSGKAYGNDILEKKITLPLIYMLNDLNETDKNSVLQFIKSDNKKEVEILNLIKGVERGGYLKKAEETANEFSFAALEKLDMFEDSESKTSLKELINYLSNRES